MAEQGGVFAVAILRGGNEFGEPWHRAGRAGAQQHVFDDFIAAATWLVDQRCTSPDRLAIRGAGNRGSADGSRADPAARPVPSGALRVPGSRYGGYWRFPNNNPPALLDYGDASKPDQFKYLLAYSPSISVTPGTEYPAVLLMTGDADTRVPPLQAARWQRASRPRLRRAVPSFCCTTRRRAMPADARSRARRGSFPRARVSLLAARNGHRTARAAITEASGASRDSLVTAQELVDHLHVPDGWSTNVMCPDCGITVNVDPLMALCIPRNRRRDLVGDCRR